MDKVERRFMAVEGRRVHYRKSGEGPPAVLLHASPANSEMVLGEMAAAAPYFTCYAFDTPGFGDSSPLPGEVLTMNDLAAATAAAMATLGLPACPVFGTHTGAAVALELGAGWPDRVSGLVLDGVPVFTEEEMASLFDNYFATFPADPLAGHLTAIWMRFRDQFTWFPWTSRNVARLNAIDRPTPEDIQYWVMMYNRGRKTYAPAYRAACYYGQGGVAAATALDRPAVFLATEEDMLFPHLDRLPPLKPNQRIERLPAETSAKLGTIVGFLRAMPSAPGKAPSPATPAPVGLGDGPAVQFFDASDGQIYTRCYGDPAHPPVVLLHDAPGTGLALDAMARRLAAHAYVIVPDLPGTGDSDAPEQSRDILDVAAQAIGALADALSLTEFVISAIGVGCAVAAAFAARKDSRLSALVVEQVPVADAITADRIAPEIALSAEGAHWLQAWLMVRDAQIYAPWFDGRIAAQRQTQGNFDAEWLHEQTFALMKSRATYHHLPRAAFRPGATDGLRDPAVPIHVAREGGLYALTVATLESPALRRPPASRAASRNSASFEPQPSGTTPSGEVSSGEVPSGKGPT